MPERTYHRIRVQRRVREQRRVGLRRLRWLVIIDVPPILRGMQSPAFSAARGPNLCLRLPSSSFPESDMVSEPPNLPHVLTFSVAI